MTCGNKHYKLAVNHDGTGSDMERTQSMQNLPFFHIQLFEGRLVRVQCSGKGSKVSYLFVRAEARGKAAGTRRGEEKTDAYHHITSSPGIHLDPVLSPISRLVLSLPQKYQKKSAHTPRNPCVPRYPRGSPDRDVLYAECEEAS